MQSEKTFLDDLARLATGAVGALGDVGKHLGKLRAMGGLLSKMRLKPRYREAQ